MGERRGLIPGAALVACLSATALWSEQHPENQAGLTLRPASEITLKQIMADPDWLGRQPEDPYWSADSNAIFFERKREGEDQYDLFRIDLPSGGIERIEDVRLTEVSSDEGAFSSDRTKRIEIRAGDLFLHDLKKGESEQLTRTADEEENPRFLADDLSVVFERDEEIFVRRLDTGLEGQAADLRLEKDPAAAPVGDKYMNQQRRFFAYLRREAAQKEGDRQREDQLRRQNPALVPPTWYLGDKIEIQSQSLSPAGDLLLVRVQDLPWNDGEEDKMPLWITDSGNVEIEDLRAKVGQEQPIHERLILFDLARFEQHELDSKGLPGLDEDPLAELRRSAAEKKRSASEKKAPSAKHGKKGEGKKPRPVEIETTVWSQDGRYAAIQFHSYDNKDRWITILDRETREKPELRSIHRLSDADGWINWSFNEMGWIGKTHQLYYLSEENGYSHLYLHDLVTDQRRQLTSGNFVVSEPQPGPDGRYLYYSANVEHPGIYEIHRVDIQTGNSETLTKLGGVNEAQLSPDGKYLLIEHSTTLLPPELYLQETRPGAEPQRLTHTISKEYRSLPWTPPEIVEVPSSHQNRPVYSRLYLPPAGAKKPDGDGKRPAVVFVHGAGYLQNAHHGWSNYFREFMFHSLLTQKGYVVLDMDYRGSAGYGRDWRTAIYRHMGEPELRDLQDGVAWLVENHGVDSERVGVYGGSYGGFMTMMALFKEPDLFAAGAALRPVTDWAHYNHPYTSNILNTPDIDPEAYRRSSPIEFAAGLTKPLLICAPMLDDNVFFLDTVRLVQHLIELEKEDFEVAIYPVEPHGFVQPSSWLDEYRRIYKLFDRYLQP